MSLHNRIQTLDKDLHALAARLAPYASPSPPRSLERLPTPQTSSATTTRPPWNHGTSTVTSPAKDTPARTRRKPALPPEAIPTRRRPSSSSSSSRRRRRSSSKSNPKSNPKNRSDKTLDHHPDEVPLFCRLVRHQCGLHPSTCDDATRLLMATRILSGRCIAMKKERQRRALRTWWGHVQRRVPIRAPREPAALSLSDLRGEEEEEEEEEDPVGPVPPYPPHATAPFQRDLPLVSLGPLAAQGLSHFFHTAPLEPRVAQHPVPQRAAMIQPHVLSRSSGLGLR